MEKNVTNAPCLYILLLQRFKKPFGKKDYNTINTIRKFKYFQIHMIFLGYTGMRLKQNPDVLTHNQDVSFHLNDVILSLFVR